MASRQQQPLIPSIAIVGISLSIVTMYFASDLHSSALFIIKATLQPISVLILLAFLCFSVYSKNKWIIASTIFACLVNTPFLLPNLESASQKEKSEGAPVLTVATFSTLTRTENTGDIVAFIESNNPDLLCLQEVSEPHRVLLLNKLKGAYPYHIQNNNNQFTLSRYQLDLNDNAGLYQKSTLHHPRWGPLNVVNTHMPRPYLSLGISNGWGKLLNAIDNDANMILCGDLNITPNNTHYDLLRYRYNLNDSHTSGYGFTYPYAQRRSALLGPMIRIDYILTRGMNSFDTHTVDVSKFSDHRAVITHLTLDES